MTTTPVQSEAVALSHIGYAEAQVVARFIDERLRAAVDERTPKVPHGIAFQGQLLRTIGWLRSLAKLDDPGGDFQAITSAARSVFESAVDVTLMHFDGYANGHSSARKSRRPSTSSRTSPAPTTVRAGASSESLACSVRSPSRDRRLASRGAR